MAVRIPSTPRQTGVINNMLRPLQPTVWIAAWLIAAGLGAPLPAQAMGLMLESASVQCGQAPVPVSAPAAAAQRIPASQAVRGQKNIQWAWLGSPTLRYPHTALGAATHAGSLHVLVGTATGAAQELVYQLPLNRVFEDRVPRLVDLDGDGRDELIVIESDALKGSAVVVFGVGPKLINKSDSLNLIELARSPHTGSTFRWLNPVGVADFDGDGQQDIASVTTPHVGGMLTLYHFRPPKLEPYAQAMDVSNHRMGDVEQQLAVIVAQSGSRPTIIVPDMQLKALHALRWEAPGKWKELADVKPLPATVQRLTPIQGGACLLLTDSSWWQVRLLH